MKEAIRNLLFLSCFLFSVAYDSWTLGINYDKQYKLYPESNSSGCMFSFSISYGQRWERLGTVAFSLGALISFTTFLVWWDKKQKQSEESTLLVLRLRK